MLNGKPWCVEVFCGTFGWSAGWLELGGHATGFDIEHLPHHGPVPERAELVLQDANTIHGSMFKDADVLLFSPPCTKYSYLAMPWSRSKDPENSKAAKALRKKWETEGPDNRLFDACFRIQREAIEATCTCGVAAAGNAIFHLPGCQQRYIPLIVENVRGAVPWVGKQQAQFGSFYLWGDVAQIGNRVVAGRDLADIRAGRGRFGMGVAPESSGHKRQGRNFHTWALTGGEVSSPSYHGGEHETSGVGMGTKGTGKYPNRGWPAGTAISLGLENYNGVKVPGQIHGKEYAMCRTGAAGQTTLGGFPESGLKTPGRSLSKGTANKFGTHNMGSAEDIAAELGVKQPAGRGDWFSKEARDGGASARFSGKSNARKAASALIAKIPYALSRYIAEQHYPAELSKTARTG